MPARHPGRWWIYWTVFGVFALVGYVILLPHDIWPRRVYGYAIGVASTAAVIVGVRIHRPSSSITWYLLATGQGLWTLGDISIGFSKYVLGHQVFPYFADCLYLLAYPIFAAALFVLIRGRTSRRDRAGLLDASIISTGLSLLTWAFVMRPLATDGGLTGPDKLLLLAYPAGDVLLIAMVARLFTTPGARTLSYRLLMAALGFVLVADVSSVYLDVTGINTPYLSLGWYLGYMMFGSAALHPSMRPLSETAPDQAVRLTKWRLSLLTATSLLAPTILIQQGLTQPRNIDWRAASIGAIVLFLLVVTRMSGLLAQVHDQAAQLDALAHNDALTGVPNRRAWDLELARHMANARRSGSQVVVALLDLDHFKRFNDQYGHQAGDRLLKEATAAWRAELRTGDLLARYGGEEFGICITGLTTGTVATLLERVQTATPLGQTFSAGIAAWTGDEAPERLVARADEALYQAKRAGRRRVMTHGDTGAPTPTRSPLADEPVTPR
jgi:diguanylate cyclase (GGDEF)-like protein